MRLAERFAIPPEDELDNLEAELMDYQLSESDDLPPYERGVTRLDKWWAEVGALKTGTGEARFPNLFTLMQCLLILPHSTAQVEGVFSLVRRIKTEFRASLEYSSLCALLACKLNTDCACFELPTTPELLHAAKQSTNVYNTHHHS